LLQHGNTTAIQLVVRTRPEKGYCARAGEIISDTNPYEAGLGFAVALNKEEIFGECVNGTIAKDPLFDPTSERIKA